MRERLRVINLLEFPSGLALSLSLEKRIETGLLKMMIRRESIANAELAHDSETDAIGERPFFVVMFAKPVSGGVKTRGINPFQPERFAAFDRIKKVCGDAMTGGAQATE